MGSNAVDRCRYALEFLVTSDGSLRSRLAQAYIHALSDLDAPQNIDALPKDVREAMDALNERVHRAQGNNCVNRSLDDATAGELRELAELVFYKIIWPIVRKPKE